MVLATPLTKRPLPAEGTEQLGSGRCVQRGLGIETEGRRGGFHCWALSCQSPQQVHREETSDGREEP